MYSCPCETPGFLPQPHHIPGYGGHIPTYKQRNGGSIGKLSRDIIEDPCVAQAPVPILLPPCCEPNPCCRIPLLPPSSCCEPPYCRNPVGCSDIGCCDPACCSPPRCPQKRKPCCEDCSPCCDPCSGFGSDCCPTPRKGITIPPQCSYSCGPPPDPCCDSRAHHLNRGPYACPCKPKPDCQIYRCCESMMSSYTGHIPGFTFHSNGRTTGKATWGTKQYMNKCFYYNTFTKA